MATKIKGQLGITKKIKDFDFFRIDAGIEFDVPEGANLDDAWQKLWDDIETQIEKKLQEEFE